MKKIFSLLFLAIMPSFLSGCSPKAENPDHDTYLDIKYAGQYALVDNYFDIQSCQQPTDTLRIDVYLINNTSKPINFIDVTKLEFREGASPENISKDDSFLIAQSYLGCTNKLNIGVGERYDFPVYLHPSSYYGNKSYFTEHPTLGVDEAHIRVLGKYNPVKCANNFDIKYVDSFISTVEDEKSKLIVNIKLTNLNASDVSITYLETSMYNGEPSLTSRVANTSMQAIINIKGNGGTTDVSLKFSKSEFNYSYWENLNVETLSIYLYPLVK